MTIIPVSRRVVTRHLGVAVPLARLPVRLSLVFLALILLGCQANPAASSSPVAGTGLVAQPADFDLGRVPFDQLAHARFTLVNQGTGEVHLERNAEVVTLEGC